MNWGVSTDGSAGQGRAARYQQRGRPSFRGRPFLSDAWLSCAGSGELAPEVGNSEPVNMFQGRSVPPPIRPRRPLATGRGLVATNARWLDLDLRLTKGGHLPRAEPPLARRIDPVRQPRTEYRCIGPACPRSARRAFVFAPNGTVPIRGIVVADRDRPAGRAPRRGILLSFMAELRSSSSWTGRVPTQTGIGSSKGTATRKGRPLSRRAALSIRRLAIQRGVRRVGAGDRTRQGYCENQGAEGPFSVGKVDFFKAWHLRNGNCWKAPQTSY